MIKPSLSTIIKGVNTLLSICSAARAHGVDISLGPRPPPVRQCHVTTTSQFPFREFMAKVPESYMDHGCSIVVFQNLDKPRVQACGLDNPFSTNKVWVAISGRRKRPSPLVLRGTCRSIIGKDIMDAFCKIYGKFQPPPFGHDCCQEKGNLGDVTDYFPINLIHSSAKLLPKVLVTCLAGQIG